MLTQLSTIKTRLAIDPFDLKNDAILANALRAITARFDKETNRTLARTVNVIDEFAADETEIRVCSYPIETVTKFELKESEATGWVEQIGTDFLIRHNCVLSLLLPFATYRAQARVTYTGGYVMPGTTAGAGQTPLPDDLEQAAVEQVSYWFQNRDKLGLMRNRPYLGTYEQFAQLDLLLSTAAVLKRYERMSF